jgi:hypothetical protein
MTRWIDRRVIFTVKFAWIFVMTQLEKTGFKRYKYML